MAKKTILLYSGWQTVNIGDIGHTPGTLRYLTQHLPDVRVVACLVRSNPAVLAMLRARFPGVEFHSGTLNAQGLAASPALKAAFEASDLVIQNSGMHYNRFWGASPWLVDLCERGGKALCFYGHSFDGFPEGTEAEWAARLEKVALVYARESDSLEYLQGIGARAHVLEWGPDGCFGIDVRDDARAEAFLRAHGMEGGGYVCVTIRTNTPKLSGAGDALNPKAPTPEEAEQDERWAAKLREVITSVVRRTGHQVLLAPEVDKEIAPARRLLFERLPAEVRRFVVCRDSFWNVDEAASIYARARAVVSMEPHSCIIALANGTPAIHFYSRKHGLKAAMFRDIGLPEWLLDIDQLPAASASGVLLEIERDPARARRKVARAMSSVHARSAEMCADISRAL